MESFAFQLGLRHGARLTAYGEDDRYGESDDIPIRRHRVATLYLPSGQLLAGDPYHSLISPQALADNALVFAQALPPGHYPFDVSIACYEPSDPRQHPSVAGYPPEVLDKLFPAAQSGRGDERIALAILCVTEKTPVHWVPADDRHAPGAEKSDPVGFGVDVGEACYVDAVVAKSLAQRCAENEGVYDEIADEIQRQQQACYEDTRSWSSIVIDAITKANLVTCSTGFGDGYFLSHWGFDAHREIACLVSDFKILTRCEARR